jgi:cytochrome c553
MRTPHGINNHFPTVFGVAVVLAALAAPANAAEAIPAQISQAEFGAQLLVCTTCHGGQNGTPRSATIPIISGQRENYLVKQIHDFQSGARDSEVMSWMARTLPEAELGAAAANFAKRDWPARPVAAASASPPAGVAVCQVCHQQNFVGGPTPGGATAPRLAGQSYEYLVETMRRYAEGERTNNGEMVTIMAALSPAERQAMARYLSGL